MKLELDKIYNMDCLEGMKLITDKSIDCIICDLPYGTTSCKWDSVIPFEPLWEQYKRIIKDSGAIVLFGSEPFSTELRHSNLKMYKYDWIWQKNTVDGFFNSKYRPLKTIENISVFSKKQARAKGDNMVYYPQGLIQINKKVIDKRKIDSDGHNYHRNSLDNKEYIQEYTNYPTEILKFDKDIPKLHPTQKPVALIEYLIKTYTNEGDIVLDNCMGSGTTAIAAINTNRHFIGFELNKDYYDIANKRIEEKKKEEE